MDHSHGTRHKNSVSNIYVHKFHDTIINFNFINLHFRTKVVYEILEDIAYFSTIIRRKVNFAFIGNLVISMDYENDSTSVKAPVDGSISVSGFRLGLYARKKVR